MKQIFKRPWILLGLAALCVLFVFPYYQRVFSPNVTTPNGKATEFLIPTGSDFSMVGEKLKKEKLISDVYAFDWVAKRMNYPNHVYPGRYILEDGMTTRELITLLRSGRQEPLRFTFVKFRTKEQLADYVGNELEMSSKDLLDLLADSEYLSKHNGLTPETAITIFIPNTYELYWNISPKAFFERMFKEYKTFWSEARNQKRKKLGLNRLEVMTLASIVEEETNKNDEKGPGGRGIPQSTSQKMAAPGRPHRKICCGRFCDSESVEQTPSDRFSLQYISLSGPAPRTDLYPFAELH